MSKYLVLLSDNDEIETKIFKTEEMRESYIEGWSDAGGYHSQSYYEMPDQDEVLDHNEGKERAKIIRDAYEAAKK